MFHACFGCAHAGSHALADERELQFGHRADDGEHRPAHRAIGVDLILDADKSPPEVVELLERRQQVARAASKAIEFQTSTQSISWFRAAAIKALSWGRPSLRPETATSDPFAGGGPGLIRSFQQGGFARSGKAHHSRNPPCIRHITDRLPLLL